MSECVRSKPSPLPTTCLAMGNSFSLSMPWFSQLLNGHDNTKYLFHSIMRIKCIETCKVLKVVSGIE